MRAGWRYEKIGWYAQGNFAPNDYVPIQSNVPPRKVDENITTAGGGEGNNPGSFRYLYSNKGFDTGVDLNQTPLLEFSADMNMNGSRGKGDFYGMQFIIAGNGSAAGQIGLDIGFQEGTSADFAQNRIAVKTVNFPAGAGNHGEQFYSVNTQASMNNTAHITVQYFKGTNGEFVVTKLNQQIVGIYKTKLTTPNQYILHAQIEDWRGKPATLAFSNIQVKKYGTDVTSAGAVNLHITNKENTAGNHFNLQANSDHWLIHGAY